MGGGGEGGGHYMSIWSKAREEGREGGEEKGAKRRQWKRGRAKGGKKVSEGETFVRQRPANLNIKHKIIPQA